MPVRRSKYTKIVVALLMERDGRFCSYCGEEMTIESASVDHIVPRAMGGGDEPANLRALHLLCNMRSGNIGRIQSEGERARRRESMRKRYASLTSEQRCVIAERNAKPRSLSARARMAEAARLRWSERKGAEKHAASIRDAWTRLTPEQHSERCRQISAGRSKVN